MILESRRANVEAEVEKGQTSLRAARALLGLGFPDECVARAYYGLFHLVCAVLLTEGLEARSHSGVDHLFNLHFVRAGRLDSGLAKAFARLTQFRLQARRLARVSLLARGRGGGVARGRACGVEAAGVPPCGRVALGDPRPTARALRAAPSEPVDTREELRWQATSSATSTTP